MTIESSSNEGVEAGVELEEITSISKTDVEENKNSKEQSNDKNFLSNLSKRLDRNSRLIFFKLGYYIAENPYRTLIYALLGAMIVAVGVIKYETGGTSEKAWVPQGTVSMRNIDRVDELYPDKGFRITQVMLTSKLNDGNGKSIATKDGILSLVEVLEAVQETSWKRNDTYTYTYDELCEFSDFTLGVSMCLTSSVLDIFFDADNVVYDDEGKVSFTSTIRAALEDMDDATVQQMLFDDPVTWEGEPFVSDLYIGLNEASDGASPDYAFLMNIAMTDTEDTDDHATYELEQVIEKVVDNIDFSEFNVYVAAFYAYEKAGQDQAQDVPLLTLGILIAIVYISFTLGHLNAVESRFALAACAIFCMVLAYIAMTGFCSLFSQAGPVHAMLPLLIVAIGIDDAFVVTSTFDELRDSGYGRSERIARALSRAGAAITVTSCTNAFAFFMGSTTQISAMSMFAVWAGFGILFVFIFMATFYVAGLTLDTRRQDNQKRDIFCCLKVKSTSSKNIFGQEREPLRRFYHDKFAPFLLKKSSSFGILLLTFGLFGSCIYGMIRLELSFDNAAFLIDGTPVREFYDERIVYFEETKEVYPVSIVTEEFDYAAEDIQLKMFDLFDENDGQLANNRYYKKNTLDSWFISFREYGGLTDPTDTFPPETFYESLQEFLNSTDGSKYEDAFVYEGSTIVATRTFGAINVGSSSVNERVNCMRALEDSVEAAGLPEAFISGREFIWFERDAILYDEAVQILLIALSTVFVVTFLLIGNVQASFITLLGPCFSVVDMLGLMYYFEIDFNTISVICLALSVGMTIDFSSHITIGFMSSVGTRYERVVKSLTHLGSPLTHAGVSTFICTGILVFATTYVFKIFFQMFMMIISLGMFHGLVLVPVVLWKFGPDGFFEYEGELEEEENLIAEQVMSKGSSVSVSTDKE